MLPAPLFLMPRAPPGLWLGLFTGIFKGSRFEDSDCLLGYECMVLGI